MIRFCKNCGTLYDDSFGPCPKCEEKRILEEDPDAHAVNGRMTPEQAARARRSAWISIGIGVPLLIGIIYILVYLMKLIASR